MCVSAPPVRAQALREAQCVITQCHYDGAQCMHPCHSRAVAAAAGMLPARRVFVGGGTTANAWGASAGRVWHKHMYDSGLCEDYQAGRRQGPRALRHTGVGVRFPRVGGCRTAQAAGKHAQQNRSVTEHDRPAQGWLP